MTGGVGMRRRSPETLERFLSSDCYRHKYFGFVSGKREYGLRQYYLLITLTTLLSTQMLCYGTCYVFFIILGMDRTNGHKTTERLASRS